MPIDRFNYFLILLALSSLGLLGNYLNLPLFFGVNFIFGSIAVLMTVRMLGITPAVLVAIVAGSYTYFIWGHPYAMLIFAAEAFVVGFLWQRKKISLALADIIFWLVIGIPLVWLFYNGVMSMEQTPALMISLKQLVNGVANAIIATYLLLLIPPQYMLSREQEFHGKIRLNELLFATLLGIPLVFSFAVVSFENKLIKENIEDGLVEQLEVYLEHIEQSKHRKNPVLIQDYKVRHKNKFNVMVFSEENTFIDNELPFSKEAELNNKGSINKINEKLSVWMPERDNLPLMLWWKKAYYFINKPLSEEKSGRIYVFQNTHLLINKIQKNILTTFELLFALIILGGVAAYYISRGLTGTISKLTTATRDIPDKLKNNTKIDWPKSNVVELLQLSQQAQMMSDNISLTFDAVNMQAKTILESSIDSIITIDENGIVLSFNHAAETLFGYERAEVLGKSFKMLVPDKHKDLYGENLGDLNMGEYLPLFGKRVESVGLHKKGQLLAIEVSVTKTEFNHDVRYTGIVTDISERKVNEQLKRDFISTVSHELRTPLTSINGSVKLIQAQLSTMKPDMLATLLDTAGRNIDRLSDLINDLLDFEKLDSSGVEYNKERINVKELICNMLEELRPVSERRKIQLIEQIKNDCYLFADVKRLSQVLVNLISNAIKFSDENGAVEIGCACEQNKIKIYVIDSGMGISEKFHEKIFQRFTQADSSDDRQIQRGTGLGLAISKRMTEDMGGTIGFESVEGKGSTFFVIFPSCD